MLKLKNRLVLVVKVLGLVVVFACILMSAFYLFTPIYDFNEGKPFVGSKVYNPYQNLDSVYWRKANFHCHTNLSDGKNPKSEVQNAYKRFGYDIYAISDHNFVLDQGLPLDYEIPVYEHGINIAKFHSLVIGAHNGSIFDFVPYYSESHRYKMLKWLSSKGEIVVFNHPGSTRWMECSDLKYLSFYKMMEVEPGFNSGKLSYYDTALSAGHYSYVLASDDCHDVNNPKKFARAATFVNTPSLKAKDVLAALDSGRTYAVTIPNILDPTKKIERHFRLPQLRLLKVEKDSVRFVVSEPAVLYAFGQNGMLLGSVKGKTEMTVPFGKSESYVRFAASFPDSVQLYTSPVARYSGNAFPVFVDNASVNYPLTVLYLMLIVCIVSFFVWLFFYMLKGMVDFRHIKEMRKMRKKRILDGEIRESYV